MGKKIPLSHSSRGVPQVHLEGVPRRGGIAGPRGSRAKEIEARESKIRKTCVFDTKTLKKGRESPWRVGTWESKEKQHEKDNKVHPKGPAKISEENARQEKSVKWDEKKHDRRVRIMKEWTVEREGSTF